MARSCVLLGVNIPSLRGLILISILLCIASPTIAADISPGDVLVVDTDSGAVRQYTAAGVYLGNFAGGLSAPEAITVDSSGSVYVSEYTANRVDKFSPSGTLLLSINLAYQPGNVEIGDDGMIYIADYFGGNVYRYSSSGTPLGLFAVTGLSRADFMAFDITGNLYVTNFSDGSIRRISSTGADLGNFISGLVGVEGITFDGDGNLYAALSGYGAANQFENIVEKISPTGEDLGAFSSFPFAPVRSQGGAYGLGFDGAGNLYVANYDGDRVEIISPSGDHLGAFAVGLDGPRDLVVVPGPTTDDQCKNGNWRTFAFPRIFKNQGDCISSVYTSR